ncbi:MAG TPA: glycosyltransferase family 1 protein [Gemmataceae bacterium]|jgi:alpha-1,3-rhamnosyl/mannosyltransferase|nr:glycosyltransferase family 1 protein [Gemmataceae bacterium]
MRVVLNRLTALRQKAGVGHYAAALGLALETQLEGDDAVLPFPGPLTERMLRVWSRLRPKRKPSNATGTGRGLGRSVVEMGFRSFCAMHRFDLYHELNNIPLPCDRPTVTTVHDLSPLLQPTWHPAERAQFFAERFHERLKQSRHIVTVSEAVRRELIQSCGVSPENVTAVSNGIGAAFRPMTSLAVQAVLRRLGLPSSYFLAVGTLEPRKNLLMLMRAYCRLPAQVRERNPLVLAGGWGWNNTELARFHHEHGRHLGVVHLGYVADDDLPALYNGALGLCFPSHYEGFGLPAGEMLACGGAVLASTTPAIAEVVGRKAALIHPDDEDGWHEAMARLAGDPDWRRHLRHGARQHIAERTWLRCARETWTVYRQVLGLEKAVEPQQRRAA